MQQFDSVPQFWQFIRGLRFEDLLVELIQNELDANALHTSISFKPDRLICNGDGESVGEDGWKRLSFIAGAGDQVEAKRFRIGVKNHGLKACFRLGDEIILRSDGRKMIQTLYKDGYDSQPSPGALPEPVSDEAAPSIGCSVEVPYRRKDLIVPRGESLTLVAPDEKLIDRLFQDACKLLPDRLMGVVRPGIREQYSLLLSHHSHGSVELRWRAKRGRNFSGRHGKQFLLFGRECNTSSNVPGIQSTTTYEHSCTFRLPFPTGKRPEIPSFYVRDKNSFLGEIGWATDRRGTPRSTKGVRRYPIAYDAISDSALTGHGIHFSGPYASDAERHGASQTDDINGYIDNACKDALVEIMASYLLHRYGGRAMELYMADPTNPEEDKLIDLVARTLDRRALPLARKALRVPKGPRRLPLGPRKTFSGDLQRVVLPMFTWDRQRVSSLLSAICPIEEDQIDRTVPSPILSYLGEHCYDPHDGFDDLVTTFDECDAIERLQPQLDISYFPWKSDSEWQETLGDPSAARIYLDVALETIQWGELESDSDVPENTYLSDEHSTAQPLAGMFSAINLPPHLDERQHVPILHPDLQDHRLLKKRGWKPKPFGLEEFLGYAQLETASLAKRKSFWAWLRTNWKPVKRQTLIRISALPVWPSTNGRLQPLDSLCEPSTTRVGSILGGAIARPSRELLHSGLVTRTGRGKLTFRNAPTSQEFRNYLEKQMERFPRGEQLTPDEQREFHKIEKDLATLVSSVPRLRGYLVELSEEFGVALDRDGYLRDPAELVRVEGSILNLHLLNEHIIDRPKGVLDRIDGWKPEYSPSTDQIVDTLREDSARIDAHVPRLQEYTRQAKREGIPPDGLVALPCIPIDGELLRPIDISLRGQRDFWNEWKTVLPMTGINPEVQRLYKTVGVVGGEPDSTNSRLFFEWLSSESADTLARHIDQILRHIGHKAGPRRWAAEFPRVPFIPVESDDGGLRLVTQAECIRKRSRVVIPDFDQLADAIRQHAGKRPVSLTILESQRVVHPISPHLRDLQVRSLRELAGDPIRVFGEGGPKSVSQPNFGRILASLLSGQKGKQLRKRLAKIGLDAPQNGLKSNWRERLTGIQRVQVSDSVHASYKLGRNTFSIAVDAELDKASGTLWLRSDSDLQASFFDVIADYIFEHPQRYYGSVLDRAYRMEMRDRYPLEYTADTEAVDEDGELETATETDEEGDELAETAGTHPIPQPDPSKNVPKPGPIPTGSGAITAVKRGPRGTARPQSTEENAQIEDLKKKQYAWHCQACVAEAEPKILAPSASYAAISQNRSLMMQAHHCDQVNAGGARHVGNILLLCRYHHLALGDAVSRLEVIQALSQARDRRLSFDSTNGVSNTLKGKVITIHPPQREESVSLFFTAQHSGYWLAKAKEEGVA